MELKFLIGNRIKELRLKSGLSQEKLANISEIDRTYITKVENGKKNVTIQCLSKICNGLNITLKDFFDDIMFGDDNNE